MQSAIDGGQIVAEPRADREHALSSRHAGRGRRDMSLRTRVGGSRQRWQQRSFRRHVAARRNETLGRGGRDRRHVSWWTQREVVGALGAAEELRVGSRGQRREPNAGGQNELAPPAEPRPPNPHDRSFRGQ